MIHKLLTGYLTLALVMGQSLCCCSVTPHASTAAPKSASSPAAAEDKQSATDHACCCKSTSTKPECEKPSGSPGADDPDDQHKCPCRGDSTNAGPAAAQAPVVQSALGPGHALTHYVASHVDTLHSVAVDAAGFSQRALESVYPTGIAMLRAFHVLRC